MANTSNAQNKMSNKIKAGLIGGTLAACLAIGGVAAYLTDTESITNNLSLDTNFSIELTEPGFVEADAQGLAPMQTVVKDPTITNDGTVKAYVAATVKVPVFSGKIIGTDGKITTVTDQDVFAYELNEGWSQVGNATVADGYRTYTYVYANALAADETAVVFDDVTVANLAEGISLTDTTIDVIGHGIQAEGHADATSAYNAYVAQNAAGVTVEP